MSEPHHQASWPFETFATFLDDVLRAAGIPESPRTGRPNSAEFDQRTGLSRSLLSRWRTGEKRPTTESLRTIADTFADDLDMAADKLYTKLMDAAGFGPSNASSPATPPADPMAAIRRLYAQASAEDQQWIRGKLEDLQEHIEMRLRLSHQSRHGS